MNATVIIDCIGMYYVLCFDAGIISLIIEIAVADDGRQDVMSNNSNEK